MVEYSAFNRIVLGSSPRHPKGYGFAGRVLATLVRVLATSKCGHSKLRSWSKFRFCFHFPEGELETETELETEFDLKLEQGKDEPCTSNS